ncbi:MAG: hotdog fold thioesterase [Micromonosporaceae bacterium]|nr:hotdog fold thioesterase [Micromonosporaceae bacterium]
MDTLEQLWAVDQLPHRMGIVVTEASPERVVGTMPVEGNTQVYGLLHGGASCVLAETLGSVGALLHAARAGYGVAVGVDINATHHRSLRSGTVTGVATPVHLGRSIASYEIVLTDEAGRRVCTARLTCALRAAPAPDPDTASGPAGGNAIAA